MSKKFLAKLLIFCMIFTMLPTTAFGATATGTSNGTTYTVTYDVAGSLTVGDTEATAKLNVTNVTYATDGDTFASATVSNVTGDPNYVTVVADGTISVKGTPEIATATDVTLTGTVVVTWESGNTTTLTDVKLGTVTVNPAGTYYTVTFNSDGGNAVAEQKVKAGETATQPADPSKTGFVFKGWVDADNKAFDFATPITANTTLKATWEEVKEGEFVITFDANGGTVSGSSTAQTTNQKLAELPTATKEGFTLKGWFTAAEGGTAVTTATVFDKATTIYAQWEAAKEYTITVMDGEKKLCETKTVGGKLTVLEFTTAKEGYFFLGVFDKDGNEIILGETVITADTTVYAKWEELEIVDFSCDPEKVKATADKAGKKITVTGKVAEDENDITIEYFVGVPSKGIVSDFHRISVKYNSETGKFTATPEKVTVGVTEYTVDLKGLEIEKYKTVEPEASVEKPENATDKEMAAYDALNKEGAASIEGIQSVVSAAKTEEANGDLTIEGTTVSAKAIEDAKEELAARVDVETAEIKTVVVPRMNIAVKGELTFNITVVADVRVTTDEDHMELGENTLNVKSGIPVTVKEGEEVWFKLTLATIALDLSNYHKDLYVKHTKSNSSKPYHHLANVIKESNVIWVRNTHGFSEFEVEPDFVCVAMIGDEAYESLQDAVDAVADKGTIVLMKDADATVSKTITFTIVPGAAGVEANIKEGTNTTVTPADNKDGSVTYTCVYSGGGGGTSGGGGSSSNVSIATKVTGGKVTVTPTRPTKGQIVTITVSPADGYKLDSLKVTDNKGNEIELTKVSDTKYTFEMPAGKVTVTPAFVKVDGSDKKDENTTNVSKRFSDVASDAWYAEYINYVAENGLMNGYEDGRFGPNDKTTRAQIVTVLYRMEGEPAVQNASSFSDVSAGGQYYSSAVAWASRNSIVNGYEDGRFGPNDNVTREQIAAILYRFAQYKGYDTTLAGNIASFSDSAKVSSWANAAIAWAVGEGLMNGDNGALRPQGNATRAEIAALLMRFCENIAK